MKKSLLILFSVLIALCFFSCKKNLKEETKTASPAKTAEEEILSTEEEPSTVEGEEPQEAPPEMTGSEHSHQWQASLLTESTCSMEGRRVWTCLCGQTKEDVLPRAEHDFGTFSCTEGGNCRFCGAKGEPLGHKLEENRCVRCNKIITDPIYVLGKALEFDASFDHVLAALGMPTETILEGEIKSLVYASDPSRLTIIQLDAYGLWGVFTFDPNAFFQIDSSFISRSTFSGKDDPESEASYQEISSCRIYGFFDRLGAGSEPYAMWMRYSECDYHYMADPRILQDLSGQAKLSFYYVNALRAMHQKNSFAWCEKAAAASVAYSQKMAEEDFFYHDGLYGTRLTAHGVLWRGCGENISQGYTSAYFVCDAYYNCLDHRNNILSSDFQKFGSGFAVKNDEFGPLSVIGTQTFYH